MKQLSPAGRCLAVAATVALAATGATAATTAPALAAPHATAGAAGATAEQAGPFVLGTDELLDGPGANGFVTVSVINNGTDVAYKWHRIADGAVTPLPPGPDLDYRRPVTAPDSDRVAVRTGPTKYRLLDMAGGAPVDVDTGSVGTNAGLWRLAGDTLVMVRHDGPQRDSLHLVTKPAVTAVHRRVSGLPADAEVRRISYSPAGALAVQYRGTVGGTTGQRLAVVDLATAKVVEDRAVPRYYPNGSVAVSATHLAWTESDSQSNVTVVTARRGTTQSTRHTPFPGAGNPVEVSVLGDWVVYGRSWKELSAVSLTDGTIVSGLLGSLRQVTEGADGLLAQGITPQGGKGVYRIGLGADGRPTATAVATNGATTPTTVLTEQVPTTADFRRAGSKAVLRWTYGRSDVSVNLEVTHTKSGRSWSQGRTLKGTETEAVFDWDGTFLHYEAPYSRTAAYNGAYTWKMTVDSMSGVGGKVVRTGTLQVDSGIAAHDYSDSGSPDLLFRDGMGRLASYDVRQFMDDPRYDWERTERGGGWQIYDRLLSAGNLDATPYADVLARDKAGVLWLYSGTGQSLATRTSVGGGWGVYDKLAAGSDLTGDGRPDLLATDRSGALWLYKATGDRTKPFAPRTRIGGGWNTYDLLTAPGDLGGAKAGDLLARDTSGVLWLYLGKGDGTFAPRTRVGGGWGVYSQIVNIGDADRDGRADLIVESGTQRDPWLYVYKGTGNWKAPFGSARMLAIPSYASPNGARTVIF
ncbi:FG-GAP repeat domain-containing protein [Streptomyces sp. NPDC012421]|uniref:FG-GAP-like repeat-containing protein n=1 Tax=Streptomyces sp. NPDC012421 TaxID=3364832 RepID=UPI0036E0C3E0